MNKSFIIFIGFKDDRIWNAKRIFGEPDWFCRVWDERAKNEIAEGDVCIFATGTDADAPRAQAWDDSARF